jgi:hypothetical protein
MSTSKSEEKKEQDHGRGPVVVVLVGLGPSPPSDEVPKMWGVASKFSGDDLMFFTTS